MWPPRSGGSRRVRAPSRRSSPVDSVARWSETVVAFARWCLCGIETAIAFAGEKWAFLVQFARAEVMRVSVVPCWECAVVLVVSTSPCCRVSCATFVALLVLVCMRARNSSPSVLTMAKNWRLKARWASYFADRPPEAPYGRAFSRASSRRTPPGELCCAAVQAAGPIYYHP